MAILNADMPSPRPSQVCIRPAAEWSSQIYIEIMKKTFGYQCFSSKFSAFKGVICSQIQPWNWLYLNTYCSKLVVVSGGWNFFEDLVKLMSLHDPLLAFVGRYEQIGRVRSISMLDP